MKKKIIIISILIILLIMFLSYYSQEKFKSYNFLNSLFAINEISTQNPTYIIEDNIILIDSSFKDEYIKYLISIYKEQGWNLKNAIENDYVFCNENNNCDYYKIYLNKVLTKKYALLVKEN